MQISRQGGKSAVNRRHGVLGGSAVGKVSPEDASGSSSPSSLALLFLFGGGLLASPVKLLLIVLSVIHLHPTVSILLRCRRSCIPSSSRPSLTLIHCPPPSPSDPRESVSWLQDDQLHIGGGGCCRPAAQTKFHCDLFRCHVFLLCVCVCTRAHVCLIVFEV